MRYGGIGGWVFGPFSLATAGVFEGDIGEVVDERGVQAAEIGELVLDNVGDFVGILGRQRHSWITEVRNTGYCTVQVQLGECGWEKEKCCADGGNEVYLIGETDTRVVSEDFDRLL